MTHFHYQMILPLCNPDLLFHSRIHPLPSFSGEEVSVWVKREDESGFGISGTKKRKYASLIPWILAQKFRKVIITGGENSNNVTGLVQMMHEFRIPYMLYLKAQKDSVKKGNGALLHLLTEGKRIRWVNTEEWNAAEALAKMENPETDTLFIPEGGSHFAAIPGLITLGLDIERNEQAKNIHFDHIFIDSGTALTSAALAYWNVAIERNTLIHVVHVAGGEADFEKQFALCNDFFHTNLKPKGVNHHLPVTAKSFGSVNAGVLDTVRRLALNEGLFTDPIYTAKLFMTAEEIIRKTGLSGNVLIIHTGGGTGLMGFL